MSEAMKVYRTCWTSAVALLAGGVAIATVATGDWAALVVTVLASAVLGALFAAVWFERSGPREAARWAAWAVAAGVLVVGLPPLLGPWSLVVLALVLWTVPALLVRVPPAMRAMRHVAESAAERTPAPQPEAAAGAAPAPGPEAETGDLAELSDRDLERRWHVTSARLRHPGTTPQAGLDLVSERVHLLDEIERRNPEHFAAILDRALGLDDGLSDGRGDGLGDGQDGGSDR